MIFALFHWTKHFKNLNNSWHTKSTFHTLTFIQWLIIMFQSKTCYLVSKIDPFSPQRRRVYDNQTVQLTKTPQIIQQGCVLCSQIASLYLNIVLVFKIRYLWELAMVIFTHSYLISRVPLIWIKISCFHSHRKSFYKF